MTLVTDASLGTLLTELSKRLNNRSFSSEELVSELKGFEGSIAEIQVSLKRLSVVVEPKKLNFHELKALNQSDFAAALITFVEKELPKELSPSGKKVATRAFKSLYYHRENIQGPSYVSKICDGYTGLVKVSALYHTHRDCITWCTESGEPVDLPAHWSANPPSYAAKKAFYINAIKKCDLNGVPKITNVPIFTKNRDNSWNVDGVPVTAETDMHLDLKRHSSLPWAKWGPATTHCSVYLLLVKEAGVFDAIGTQAYVGRAVNGTASRWRSNGVHHEKCISKAIETADTSVQLVELVLALIWIRDKSWKNVALIDFRYTSAEALLNKEETDWTNWLGSDKYYGLNS